MYRVAKNTFEMYGNLEVSMIAIGNKAASEIHSNIAASVNTLSSSSKRRSFQANINPSIRYYGLLEMDKRELVTIADF